MTTYRDIEQAELKNIWLFVKSLKELFNFKTENLLELFKCQEMQLVTLFFIVYMNGVPWSFAVYSLVNLTVSPHRYVGKHFLFSTSFCNKF